MIILEAELIKIYFNLTALRNNKNDNIRGGTYKNLF